MSVAGSRYRWLLLLAVGNACSFDPQGYGPGPSGADAGLADAAVTEPPDAGSDAAVVVPFCDGSDPTLVACYRFEDPGDPLLDESSYLNDGTATNVDSLDGPPGHGLAIGFRSNSTTGIADDVSLDVSAITLEMWVRPASLPSSRFGLLDNNGQYGLFLAPDGKVRCSMSSTTSIALGLPVNAWSHIACSYDGSVIRMYQDGELRDMTTTSVQLGQGNPDGMCLGMNSPSGDVLDGAIDDVRVWNVARSAPAICRAADRDDCAP